MADARQEGSEAAQTASHDPARGSTPTPNLEDIVKRAVANAQKPRSVWIRAAEIAEKLVVPLVVGALVYLASDQSNQIAEARLKAEADRENRNTARSRSNLEATFIELLYPDIASNDPFRIQRAGEVAKRFLHEEGQEKFQTLMKSLADLAQSNAPTTTSQVRPNPAVNTKSKDTSSSLRKAAQNIQSTINRRNKVDLLFDDGKLEEALRADPGNVIVIMKYIEEQVAVGNYEKAVAQFANLRVANGSGVGFSVYPEIALAYDKLGESRRGVGVLESLERRIKSDVNKGYGYLSRVGQIGWVKRDLLRVEKKVSDNAIKAKLKSVVGFIDQTAKALLKAP